MCTLDTNQKSGGDFRNSFLSASGGITTTAERICTSTTTMVLQNGQDAQEAYKLDEMPLFLFSSSWFDEMPTLEEVRSWGDSFEKLMRSSAGQKVFREFLKCEYSEENILFWLACEDLKKQSKPEVIEEKARIIYEDYISILSPKEVSLDSRVREVVNQNMVDPTPHTFDEAQVQIFTLMHRDSYPRFVNSPLYKKLAQLNNTSQHRGSSVSAISNPASRKQSIAS